MSVLTSHKGPSWAHCCFWSVSSSYALSSYPSPPLSSFVLKFKSLKSDDSISSLQTDIDLISLKIMQLGLRLNAAKTNILLFILRRKSVLQPLLSVDVSPIQQVDSVTYLGVCLTSNLTWASHIDGSYANLSSQLNWSCLFTRRRKQKTALCYRIVNHGPSFFTLHPCPHLRHITHSSPLYYSPILTLSHLSSF